MMPIQRKPLTCDALGTHLAAATGATGSGRYSGSTRKLIGAETASTEATLHASTPNVRIHNHQILRQRLLKPLMPVGSAKRPRRWNRHSGRWVRSDGGQSNFSHFNLRPSAPDFDDHVYDKYLAFGDWTREETDYLMQLYTECNGKWPVIIDHYSYDSTRSMEDLKARFYSISATVLQLNTPITSMTAPEYSLYETLNNFNPGQETSRKKLAEGHLQRKPNEVDEESVLLSELQRIMVNQATVDSERDDLRRRLEYPHANTNGYQYSTSQALTGLWQQMLAADRMKKNQRLRPTGHPLYDGFPAPPSATTTSSRPQPAPTPALPVDLSKADMLRFGVVQSDEKFPAGVAFVSDKIAKHRYAKSNLQADKISTVLRYAGLPEMIALATAPVLAEFEVVMGKVHSLLELRKLKDKEEQEVRVREAELARQ